MKNAHIYKNKVSNSTFYGTVKITGDENKIKNLGQKNLKENGFPKILIIL
jgi:hypothetical protein